MFLGESFPLGNYVGDNSSERHSEAISRGILSGGNYLWDNFQGAIIQGTIPQGGNFPRGQLSSGAIVRGAIIRGAIVRTLLITIRDVVDIAADHQPH